MWLLVRHFRLAEVLDQLQSIGHDSAIDTHAACHFSKNAAGRAHAMGDHPPLQSASFACARLATCKVGKNSGEAVTVGVAVR
jgi:hypothetical protein